MAEQQKRRKQPPGKPPDEGRDPYVAPRDEEGASEEVVRKGKLYYATENVPRWPTASANRQYIATPEEMQEIQHGAVTWIDAASSDKDDNDNIDREHRHGHRSRDSRPANYEL
ncbi:hypothetical protein [Methanocella arvoryzae]|uniref:Uncharacterized protein n=1 Tax=Methanocella arvoryzae (strain DSM 22066 / NBRC 105507 / MRE50) TaxID=351160 RepID=Q0W0K2_METAR|nr:hypothetical protein [Methanocella arvoryzae]CAJ38091.1 hypothetical protein RRC377 [Methanocella arvoryzae MRE50]